jgi:copper transport protein
MTFVRRSAAAVLAMVVAGIVLVVGASPVWAHIELAESDPPNVSTVDEPVEVVRLTFTDQADPVVDQFAIEDPVGNAVAIDSIEPDGDGATLAITPEHALAGGRHRVSWAIRSGDSHVMNGTVAFTVTAEALPAVPSTGEPEQEAVGPAAPTPEASDASPTQGAERVATGARWLVYAALLFCVGGLGYLTWVHRGSASEGRYLVYLVRRAALLVVIGAAIEFLAQVVVFDGGSPGSLLSPSAWAEVITAAFGTGTLLRLVGAGLVLGFLRIDLDHTFVLDGDGGFDELSADDLALLEERTPGGLATKIETEAPPLVRPRVEASPVAFLGAILLVASEAFLGHTATTEPRALVVASDAGHLIAGGLWAAGAVMLAATISRRHRRDQPLDARLLASRFSVVASWSLGVVALTGAALAWGILGDLSAVWSTTFGRVLLAKILVVGTIAAIGGYNHKVLVPALQDGADRVEHQFRRTVTTEALLFAAVLALTAVLVASNTTG